MLALGAQICCRQLTAHAAPAVKHHIQFGATAVEYLQVCELGACCSVPPEQGVQVHVQPLPPLSRRLAPAGSLCLPDCRLQWASGKQ